MSQLLAVLRDRAPRHGDALLGEQLGERWSDTGLAGSSSPTISRSRCLMLVAATSMPWVGPVPTAEEVLELEQAVRRRHVLAGHSARDGRQVHADLDGDVLEAQRPQQALAVLEELALHLEDDLRDARDRVLAPVDVLDEALRRADLVLEVLAGLVVGGRAALEHRAVPRRHAQRGNRLVVRGDEPLVIEPAQRHVGNDVARRRTRRERAGRPRIQRAQHVHETAHLVLVDLERPRDLAVVVRRHVVEVALDDASQKRLVEAQELHLQAQRLGEIPRADAGRIELLHGLEALLGGLGATRPRARRSHRASRRRSRRRRANR